jgi:hypothetical protein
VFGELGDGGEYVRCESATEPGGVYGGEDDDSVDAIWGDQIEDWRVPGDENLMLQQPLCTGHRFSICVRSLECRIRKLRIGGAVLQVYSDEINNLCGS